MLVDVTLLHLYVPYVPIVAAVPLWAEVSAEVRQGVVPLLRAS